MAFTENGTTLINDSGALSLTGLTLTSTDRLNVGITAKLPTATFQGVTAGFTSGGYVGPKSAVIDKFTFAADNTSTNVGSISQARYNIGGNSSATFGYTTGGINPSDSQNTTTIDKYPFSISSGTGTSVGALSTGRQGLVGQSSIPYGYGWSTGGQTGSVIDKFAFASDGNATSVGTITVARYTAAGQSSATYGYTSGGVSQDNSTYYSTIDKFPFASSTNATSVGSLAVSRRYGSGLSSTISGYTASGQIASATYNTIDKFPFATDTNATGVASLAISKSGAAGVSSTDYGYSVGAYLIPSTTVTSQIDRFGFAADTSGIISGALSQKRYASSGQQV